jgi:hypothetical protein
LAKLFFQVLKNFSVKNAPSAGKSGGGVGGSFNRDPKAIQVKRVGYQLSNGAGGGGRDSFETPDADFALIGSAIKRDSYLMQAIMKYEELIFKSGWSFQGKNEQALEYLKLRLAMMAIATNVPTEELFSGIASDIVRYSNSFIVKAPAKGGQGLPPGLSAIPVPPRKDPVGGYFRLPPESMSIARDKNGTVVKYQQEVQGADKPLEFRPEDIIHIKYNVPSGRPFGDPWLAPVLEDVRLLRKVEENAALLLYRHIFPLLMYKVGIDKPGYEATDEELTDLRAIIEDMPTDGAIVLPERHNVEAVKIDAIDGKPYLEYFENRVFSGLGMSQVDFGRGDTANRNTADAMTGNKADRVKGWQQSIAIQIDKYMIDEILVEGGFDPLVNPEFNIDFVFNEIELERKIAKETHEIFKFNNNMQSWEETRMAIGSEPVTDEARLHFQMIGMQTAEHAASLAPSGEAGNKNQPENQNGKRSGPKRSTEAIHEKYFTSKHSPPVYNEKLLLSRKKPIEVGEVKENVFQRVPIAMYEKLKNELEDMYRQVEADTLESFTIQQKTLSYPVADPKTLLASVHFGKDKMLHLIQSNAASLFEEGIQNAKKDMGRNNRPKFNQELAMQTLKGYAEESLGDLQERIRELLSDRLAEAESNEKAVLAVKGIFESLRFKMKTFSKTILSRSYNYGYAISLMSYGEEEARVVYEGSCKDCLAKSEELIKLKQLSSLDEVAIFYRIPPWHPNCECELRNIEGGEM